MVERFDNPSFNEIREKAKQERAEIWKTAKWGDYIFPYEVLAAATPRQGLKEETLRAHHAVLRTGITIDDVIHVLQSETGISDSSLTGSIVEKTSQALQELVMFKQGKLPAFPRWKGL